jgi:hypothetical protein
MCLHFLGMGKVQAVCYFRLADAIGFHLIFLEKEKIIYLENN